MVKVKHITHKKSDVANKAPKAEDLANGEIAVNYAKDTERLYIKNKDGEVVPFSSDHIIIGGIIDTVLASKTSARGYDTSNPTLANVYGSKESLNSVLKHYKMGLFKDGALVKECAPCRITKAVDGSDIKIDGSEGDIMLYIDKPIYRDRCRVSGVTVPGSTATTHNVIGLGLMPHQVGGKEAKKMNPFAFTPGYVQFDGHEYRSCYSTSFSGSGHGSEDIMPFFTTNFIGENGAQGGYPVVNESCIENMRRSRAKGPEYKGIFYEFYEMWLIAMYLELGTLNFTGIDSFGIGCCNDYAYRAIRPSASNWISGGLGSVLVKNMYGDGVDNYYALTGPRLYFTANGAERSDTAINGLLGNNHSNFEEALESQRFVDALVKSNLTSKVDGATVLEYDTDGNVRVPLKEVNLSTGENMDEGKKYYVIRNVPNCQGIGDGVMTYVLNVFVKTTCNYNVEYNGTNVGSKDVIFKFSYPTYRGLELFSGALTQIEGIHHVLNSYDFSNHAQNGSIWYAKDFDDIKYDPTNHEPTYDDYNVLIGTPDEDIPFIKGFVKGGEFTDKDGGWVKNTNYDVSLYCATECDDNAASETTYECGYVSRINYGDSIYKAVGASIVGCSLIDNLVGRTLYSGCGVDSKLNSLAGGFSIGNPTL